MSSNKLVKEHKQRKFKEEISTIEYRLVESISNLEIMDNKLTNRLITRLNSALYELERVKEYVDGSKQPFELPDGYREKMTPILIETFAEGKDYSGYIYEQAESEVIEMNDEEFYESYCECHSYEEDGEEQDEYIKTIEDILAKEQLEEALNE
jgi:hypothetical protein